jgi:hypothetical protein
MTLLITLTWAILVAPRAADVPPPATPLQRIGVRSSHSPLVVRPSVEAVQQRLRAWGYVEGQHLALEDRYAEGLAERLAELVRLPVEVLVTGGAQAIRASQQATRTIPIVMAGTADPVAVGVAGEACVSRTLRVWWRQTRQRRIKAARGAFPPEPRERLACRARCDHDHGTPAHRGP